ncbi:MAG: hypothetical protein O3C34_15015 [Proteobacteria bacterium]|nr:hypothetical protein [Pseudomonadota bacterium]
MATIIPFPNAMPIPVRGLTKQECNILDAEAAGLIHDGQATGVSIHNDGQYMCVYDCDGEPYFIGREEGMCYLFDYEETMLAKSPRFEIVLQALDKILKSSEDARL